MEVVRMISLGAISFIIAFGLTPFLTDFLYRHKDWFGKQIRQDRDTPIFRQMHQAKAGTPTMGGVLIWGTTLVVLAITWLLAQVSDSPFFQSLSFLDRSQTYLPFGALLFAGAFGLIDDVAGVLRMGSNGGGLKFRWRFLVYLLVSLLGAWWFFYKLEWNILYIPFVGNVDVGFWSMPIFVFILLATVVSANETDGLDGLLGGVSLFSLGALAAVAFSLGRFHLAAFLSVIMGALLAFLWFNIYPARFFMGDTGAITLGVIIGVVAMLTNTALFLPFFAFILVIESASVIIQLFWKYILGRKFFLSSPIHHHFEALGWPEPKVVMRFWIISAVMAGIGLVLYFASIKVTGGLL